MEFSASARPSRGRPHWWVVLAVSLALMALVTATTGERSVAPPDRRDLSAVQGRSAGSPSIPRAHQPGAATTTPTTVDTLRTTTPVAGASGSHLAAALGAKTPSVPAVDLTPSPVATTTTTTPSTTGSGDGSSPVAAGGDTQEGYLQPPDNASADYVFNGSGPVEVDASWTPTIALTLSVTCPGATQSVTGSGSAAVTLPDAEGSCTAALAEAPAGSTTVSYSLQIGPTDGG